MTTNLFRSIAAALALAVPASAFAGETYTEYQTTYAPSPFEAGSWEFELLAGPYFSVSADNKLHYFSFDGRIGYMVTSPAGAGALRGNFELLLDLFGGAIFEGAGDGLLGANLLFRWNFVQPDARLVPYIQVGGGGVYSDAAETDLDQREIGSDWSFHLQAALGVRYMVSDQFAITVEGGYRHISNADTSDRNIGLNSLGALVGFNIFF